MMKELPQQPDPESLSQLDKEELVVVVIEQQKIIEQLRQEIERLKVSRDLDSQTSSKPPSGDLLKKPEKNQLDPLPSQNSTKRKPGGQPGHTGKTRTRVWSSRPLRTGRTHLNLYQPTKCYSRLNTLAENKSLDPAQ